MASKSAGARGAVTVRFGVGTKAALDQAKDRVRETLNQFVVRAVQERCKHLGVIYEENRPAPTPVPAEKYQAGRRDQRLDLRVSKEERELIDAATERLGCTRTELIVEAVLAEAARYGIDREYIREMRRLYPSEWSSTRRSRRWRPSSDCTDDHDGDGGRVSRHQLTSEDRTDR